MASPLRHDFSRTMKSGTVVGSMIVIIALSVLFIPVVRLATSAPGFSGSGATDVMGYYSGSEYHFLGYSFNTYGQPVEGTSVNITVSSSSGSRSSAAGTNSSGFASWTMQAPPPRSGDAYVVRLGGALTESGAIFSPSTNGSALVVGGPTLQFVTDHSNSSRSDVVFVDEGPNGSAPSGYSAYYNYTSSAPGFFFGLLNESQMTFLGHPSGVATLFKLPPMPKGDDSATVEVFDSNGTVVATANQFSNTAPYVPPSPTALFTSLASSILALAIPLMAVLVAYNSYGKDKATGVLESVLTRPVTRRGLGLSRYLAMVISITLAIAITVGVIAIISQVLLGATLPLDVAVYSVGGLAVEAAAFVGIIMLLSQFVKSSGGIVGAGVILWVLLDLLWGIFMLFGALALRIQIGSGDYLALTIRSGFANPAQFFTLVGEYLNGLSLVSSLGGSVPISPATYGLTPIALVAAGAFWVVAPLAGFLYAVVRRD